MKSYLKGTPENEQQFKVLTEPNFDSFVALDFETTGLSRDKSEIIEIGAIKVRRGKPIERFATLVCPPFLVSPVTESVTGITNAGHADQPEMREIFPIFMKFIDGEILVGHNIVSFDSKFLAKTAARYGQTPDNSLFDTLTYARKINHEKHIFASLNLGYLTDYFDIEQETHHRAFEDALANIEVFFRLREIGLRENIN